LSLELSLAFRSAKGDSTIAMPMSGYWTSTAVDDRIVAPSGSATGLVLDLDDVIGMRTGRLR
jgi:hypothetical protein